MDSPASSTKSISSRILPAAAFLLLLAVVYTDPLFTGRNFSGRDLLPYGMPMEKTIHDAWSRGRVPVWATDLSGGRPILPNPNTGTLYPVRPLLSRLPFPLAMRLFPILHWASAGIGMLLLLGAVGASSAASWVAAATFVFSGVSISQVFYQPFGAAVALHPWLLWALVRSAPPRRKAVVLGLVWGLEFLLGDVFAIAIALLAAALWIALGAEPSERRRTAGTLVLGVVLGALLAAPQIVATALLVPETQRAVTAIPLREALRYTVSPWRLVEFAIPFPYGQVWTLEDHLVWGRQLPFFYQTISCGAFALIALVVATRSRERAARFAVALFAAGVALAVFGTFVPDAWMTKASPVPLRYPEKFTVAAALALAFAAGLAFDRLRRTRPRLLWPLGVAVLLTVLAAASALFPLRAGAAAVRALGDSGEMQSEAAEELPAALAEGAFLWLAAWIAIELLRSPRRGPELASLALLTAIPIAAHRRIARTEHTAALFAPTAFARAVARRDPAGAYRTIDEAGYRPPTALQLEGNRASPYGTELTRRRWGYHTQALWNLGTVFNIDVDRGDFSRLDSLRQISSYAATQPDGAAFFSSLSLRFGVRFRDQEPLPGFQHFGGDAFMDWDENPAALPDIRLVRRWREAGSAVDALRILPKLAADEVVLETGRSSSGSAEPGLVRVLERSPERLRLTTSSRDPGWLFVLRGFWGHRTIRIDGAPADGVPAQLAFTAVAIPAGDHAIDWREDIPGIEISRYGPAAFVVIAVALSVSSGRAGSARA